MSKLIQMKTLLLLTSIFLLFAIANWNFEISIFYLGILLVGGLWVMFDVNPKVNIPLEKDSERIKSIITTLIFLFSFLFISTLVVGAKLGATQSITDVVKVWATTQPLLSSSIFINNLTYALIIPILETIVIFGLMFEGIAQRMHIPIEFNPRNLGQWALIVIISLIFTALHFSVRGVTNISGLIMTFLFAAFSIILILYAKDMRGAIVMHILNNSAALFLH